VKFFDSLAEMKIAEAIENGELSGLSDLRAPLQLDDDALIPEDFRMAYRILRNAGCLPLEVGMLREIGDLQCGLEAPAPVVALSAGSVRGKGVHVPYRNGKTAQTGSHRSTMKQFGIDD